MKIPKKFLFTALSLLVAVAMIGCGVYAEAGDVAITMTSFADVPVELWKPALATMPVTPIIVESDRMRAAYNRIKTMMGANPNKFIIQTASLRVENDLSDTKTSYNFKLAETSGNASQHPLEVRLIDNDIFVLVYLRMGIQKYNFVSATSARDYGNYPNFYYPDGTAFAGAGEASALENLYNSKLSFKTDSVVRIEDLITSNFRFVPETQQAATTVSQQGGIPENKGYVAIQPDLVIAGKHQNEFDLILPTGVKTNISGGTGDPGTRNLVFIECYGFKIKNADEALRRTLFFANS